MSRARVSILPRLCALAALALASCRAAPPNLLLIVSDSLRGDMLSCYGGPARTPNICSLAQRGALFERSWANGAWTLPSSVAIFTGQQPNAFARRGEAAKNDFYFVDAGEELLAETLAARGYHAVAFVENQVVLRPNVLQGFERKPVWRSDWLRSNHADFAARTGFDVSDFRSNQIAAPIQFLRREAREPFAALVWIMDPHATYSPEKRFASTLDFDYARLPHPPDYYARLAAAEVPKHRWLDFSRLAPSMSAAELEFVRLLYRSEIESVDERVGWLLAELERGGRRGRTHVVFTSDHGEGFLEHGMVFHADERLFEEFVRVPLLIAGPGIARGRRYADAVSHLDLLPTLRELLGLPASASDQGHSLAARLRGEVGARPETTHYISGNSRAEGFAAIVGAGHKLLLGPDGVRLFDLVADPGERNDIALRRPDLVRELRAAIDAATAEDSRRLAAHASRADAVALKRAEAETLEALRELGYVEDEAQEAEPIH